MAVGDDLQGRSCVTMSSSSGKSVHVETHALVRVYYPMPALRPAPYVAGKWTKSRCSDLHGYVCKRETVSVVETPREPHYIGGCPEKWLYFGHKVQINICSHTRTHTFKYR